MKKIFRTNTILLALLTTFALPAMAAGTAGQLFQDKTATYDYESHIGEITLESFVTGEMVVTQKAMPLDVVLVLDYSGTMDESYKPDKGEATSFTKTLTKTTYTYSDLLSKTISYNGTNYQVHGCKMKGVTMETAWAWIEVDGRRYYLQPQGDIVRATNNDDPTLTSFPKAEIDGRNIQPTNGTSDIIWCDYKTDSGASIGKRIDALRYAVNNFIDGIAKHSSDGGVTDRISMITFSGSGNSTSWPTFKKPGETTSTSANDYVDPTKVSFLRQYTAKSKNNVVQPFTSVGNQHDINVLKHALNIYDYSGSTATNKGLELAKLMMTNYARTSEDVMKVVIVFTDGKPEQEGGHTWYDDKSVVGSPMWTAKAAIEVAKTIKGLSADHSNYFVYTIYCNKKALGSSSDDKKVMTYMNYMSSNYPDASDMSTTGSGTPLPASDQKYFKQATDNLETVFGQVTQEIQTDAGTQYGAETLVRDFVNSNYFKLPDGAEISDIHVYKQACTAVSGTTYSFGALTPLTVKPKGVTLGSNEVNAIITTGATPNDPDLVEVYGFDYAANWCGIDITTSKARGAKLVIKFPFVFKGGHEVSGALETNTKDSGIYPVKRDSEGNPMKDADGKPIPEDSTAGKFTSPTILFNTLTISRENLDPGETAIYEVFDTAFICRVALGGERGKSMVSKTIYGLPGNAGTQFTARETNWNWAYHTDGGSSLPSKTCTVTLNDKVPVPMKMEFTGPHIADKSATNVDDPVNLHNHGESFVVNKLTIPSSSH